MTKKEKEKLQRELDIYDEERARGLVHTRPYSLKMERYRRSVLEEKS